MYLPTRRDGDLLLGVVHPAQQVVPHRPVDVAERQVEAAYDVGVEALAVQHLGDVVDRRGVRGGDHGLLVDVAHQRDLPLDRLSGSSRSARQTTASGWMPIERSAATECWVGLVFSSPEGPM